MRQEMLTARDQGRDEFAMPEQPTELEVNEFKLAQPPLRRLVSTRPGRHQRAQGFASSVKSMFTFGFWSLDSRFQDQIIFVMMSKNFAKKLQLTGETNKKQRVTKKVAMLRHSAIC